MIGVKSPMRICFFADLSAHENRRQMLRAIEFYNADLVALRALGHEVIEATTFNELDHKADLYYCWWWGPAILPLILGKLRRKPVIVTGAFDYTTCRDELPGLCYLDRPAWQKAIIKTVLRLADASMFVSHYEFDEVTRNLSVKRPFLVPHSVDVARYKPHAHGPFIPDFFFSLAWTSAENVVRKGVVTALKAFAKVAQRHPNVRFVQAGKPGNAHKELIALTRELAIEDRVDFVGMISVEEKLRHFRQCIAYVQPTLYEGFGVAIAEAAATGCAIIATTRGAVPEVSGPDPTLVNPKSVDEIADAMSAAVGTVRLYENELKRHHWISERYDLRIRQERLEAIIRNLTSKS